MPRLTEIRKRALDEMMKESLFEATVAVLGEHGVDGMTMERVAMAAGMAKGSVYNYFGSKRDLLEFVYAKIIDPIFQKLVETVASDRPAREKLAKHLRDLLDHVAKQSQVFKLLFEDDSAHGLLQSTERRTREAACQQLAEVFRQGVTEGVFRPSDPLVLARQFFGVCAGTFDSRPELAEPDQRESVFRLIMDTFLNGIATDKGRVG